MQQSIRPHGNHISGDETEVQSLTCAGTCACPTAPARTACRGTRRVARRPSPHGRRRSILARPPAASGATGRRPSAKEAQRKRISTVSFYCKASEVGRVAQLPTQRRSLPLQSKVGPLPFWCCMVDAARSFGKTINLHTRVMHRGCESHAAAECGSRVAYVMQGLRESCLCWVAKLVGHGNARVKQQQGCTKEECARNSPNEKVLQTHDGIGRWSSSRVARRESAPELAK